MGRTKGTYTLTSNIEPKVGAPLDARTIVKLLADLTASNTFEYPYKGMRVFVEENNKSYTLVGSDPTVSSNWTEDGSGGGHVIKNQTGTDMNQRSNLQFVDMTLSDDAINDITKVENIHVIQSESELDNLPDGLYMLDDDEGTVIDGNEVGYDNTDSGLRSRNIQDAIDELAQGGGGGGISDVQVDGQSVVNQGVANLTTPDLVDLPDVDITHISDGQILKWDAYNNKFINANENAGGVQFNLFTKAFIAGNDTIARNRTDFPSYSQIVIDLASYLNKIITITNSGSRNFYGFTATVPEQDDALLAPRIDSGGSLVINYTGTGGRYLVYDFTSTGESISVLGISVADPPIAISDLSDANVSSPANGQVLKYNSTTGKWENSQQMLFMASYGSTSFAEILAAYKANAIVYCKASSNSDPASGAQLRQAFLAYIGGSTDNPTNFEFQYYCSVSSKSASQQGDQVFVYTISSNNTWTVTSRNTFTEIVTGTGLTSSYSNGVLTISLA